jgi:hypothetical protein
MNQIQIAHHIDSDRSIQNEVKSMLSRSSFRLLLVRGSAQLSAARAPLTTLRMSMNTPVSVRATAFASPTTVPRFTFASAAVLPTMVVFVHRLRRHQLQRNLDTSTNVLISRT